MKVAVGDVEVRGATSERAKVLQLMKAIERGNWSLVARICRGTPQGPSGGGWSPAGLLALQLWLGDILGGQTQHYSVAERFNLDRTVPPRQLKAAWETAQLDANPTLVVSLVAMALLGR